MCMCPYNSRLFSLNALNSVCSKMLTLDYLLLLLQVSLSPGHMFDRDVELLAYYSGAHEPTAIVEMGQPKAKSGEPYPLAKILGGEVL